MTSREKFEAWMTDEQWFHGSDFEWDERRNCYAQFGIHLAYKAFLAAEGAAEQKLTDMAVQLANAESKCREMAADNEKAMESLKQADAAVKLAHEKFSALAAENAGLKSAKEIIRHLNANREEANFCGIDDCHIDDAIEAMLTPATDAFLAEVRASAIEAFADNQEKIADEELVGGNLDLSLRFRGMARAAKEFAAQIRKEAAQ